MVISQTGECLQIITALILWCFHQLMINSFIKKSLLGSNMQFMLLWVALGSHGARDGNGELESA